MRLPEAERAVVEAAKIRDYLLSPTHPVGCIKAAFFRRLGYTRAEWRDLERAIRELVLTAKAVKSPASPYGDKYEVRGIIWGPSGRAAEIVTIWIIRTEEDFPRLVTAYPGDR